MTAQDRSIPHAAPQSPPERQAILYVVGVGLVVTSFIVLLTVNPNNLLYPLWSSIALPLLILVPFILINFKVKNWAKFAPGLVVILVMIPILGLTNTSYSEYAIQIGIFAAMAIGLNIVVGFAGLLDLGYVAFFAVGAYLWGIFTSQADIISKTNGWQAAPDLF